ncbi:MAG: hypothetical protein VCD66_08715 [Alphaproteobacteria bacterium]|jgi:hypothetical protein
MTLSASSAADRYAAAEAQTVFPYTFKILDAAHLKIYEDETEVTTGFTISGVGSDTIALRQACMAASISAGSWIPRRVKNATAGAQLGNMYGAVKSSRPWDGLTSCGCGIGMTFEPFVHYGREAPAFNRASCKRTCKFHARS